MNIKILAQNIVNNPSDFTTEQIEKYFQDYAELRLSDVRLSLIAFEESKHKFLSEKYKHEYAVNVVDEYLGNL